ncbi:hypothetical protein B0T25DRAFT_557699 [Lasiosphaeria hispida]|uniref:Secreted protein n=1 Tax=Lasiosphaeria hispida TaxID=260671 RepID=A0AAJ0H5U6_9PEZI|nr:hypothetical protein B0T25DRAFT_557699 [Lasiosphaeria hispida]
MYAAHLAFLLVSASSLRYPWMLFTRRLFTAFILAQGIPKHPRTPPAPPATGCWKLPLFKTLIDSSAPNRTFRGLDESSTAPSNLTRAKALRAKH